jgi:hypothetical protein
VTMLLHEASDDDILDEFKRRFSAGCIAVYKPRERQSPTCLSVWGNVLNRLGLSRLIETSCEQDAHVWIRATLEGCDGENHGGENPL